MSVGPPENYEHQMDPSDVAEPTRPSERGAWRHHWAEDDDEDTTATTAERSPVPPTWRGTRAVPESQHRVPPTDQ